MWDKQVEEDASEAANGVAGLAHEHDGVEEPAEALVVALVGEDVVEPGWDQGGAQASDQGAREDKSVSSGHWGGGNDADTGDGDRGEQEGGHSTEHGLRDGSECGSKLGEDAHDDEEEATEVACSSVGTLCDGDDTVVLGKRGHGGTGEQVGEQAVEAVGQHTALDSGVVHFALHLEPGHIAGCGDVPDGLHHQHDVGGQHGQHSRAVDFQLEGLDPEKSGSWGRLDARLVKVATRGGNNAPNEQPHNDGTRLHDRGAPFLAHDDDDEHQEPQANELSRAVLERFGSGRAGTQLANAPGAADPVLEARGDERDADEQHDGARDERREHLLEDGWRDEGEENLEQRADGACREDASVAVRAGQVSAVRRDGALAVLVHERDGLGDDGDGGEGGAHDRDEPRADVVLCAQDVEAGDLHQGQDARGDEGRGHEVLCGVVREVCDRGDDEGRRDDARQHRQRVLEPQQQPQQHGQLAVEPEEGLDLLLLLEERDLRGEEVLVVVVAHQAVLGGELSHKAHQRVLQRLWVHLVLLATTLGCALLALNKAPAGALADKSDRNVISRPCPVHEGASRLPMRGLRCEAAIAALT